jgi:hypothetical protein
VVLGEIYIPDTNPFNLEPPPLWWQQGLWAFDADLRILPGRKRPVWWLARVQRLSRGLTGEAIVDDQADTAMFVRHNLISVTWIASTEGWSEGFLQYIVGELVARDTWAVEGGPLTEDLVRKAMFEGGSKYGRMLDDRDDADRARINKEVREDVYHATGEAWRSRQARTGERILNAGRPSELPSPTDTPLSEGSEP